MMKGADACDFKQCRCSVCVTVCEPQNGLYKFYKNGYSQNCTLHKMNFRYKHCSKPRRLIDITLRTGTNILVSS
jgi:hypothetical protein